MYPFNLRGERVHVETADVYASALSEEPPIATIYDKTLVIRGIVLARRHGVDTGIEQSPFAHTKKATKDEKYPSEGIWLNEATFSVIDPPQE